MLEAKALPQKRTHPFCRFRVFRCLTIAFLLGGLLSGCAIIGCEKTPKNRAPGPHISLGKNHSWSSLPTSKSDTTFIFVHGILSGSENCWLYKDPKDQNKDAYWPQILAEDPEFADCGVYLAGYGTSFGSGKYSVSDAVDSMITHLRQSPGNGEPKPLENSNIVFIAHSLGGIVIRDLLTKYPEDFQDKKLGLVLIASPSLGSKYADYLTGISELYKNDMATNLKTSDKRLSDLDDRFRILNEKSNKDRGFCLQGVEYLEAKFVFGGELNHLINEVVAKENLWKYWGKERRIFGTDHFTIVKPSSGQSEVHIYLRDFWSAYRKSTCGQVLPPITAPIIEDVRVHQTDIAKDLNVKVIFERPQNIPNRYKLRFEFSIDGNDWNAGRLDSSQYYELDSTTWPSVVEPVPDPGFSCGKIRPTLMFVRISVVSPEGKVVASSKSSAIKH